MTISWNTSFLTLGIFAMPMCPSHRRMAGEQETAHGQEQRILHIDAKISDRVLDLGIIVKDVIRAAE
ncbi:MAG: hypothetical protein EPN45_01415 [Rhizobiaceae bacterium]|nr:MAG: hypothetical protein EPN45_01415 [Rhizobiaceae bacterium]